MPCEKCGCAVEAVDSTPHSGEGTFREEWECANGHKGFITGREEEPPATWQKLGVVFNGDTNE